MDKKWYSAKQIFLHEPDNKKIKSWYEERIILITAENHSEAIEKALKDGEDYCNSDFETCYFLDLVDDFELYNSEIEDKVEVFSSKTISSLSANDFLCHFYPDSPPDCEQIGDYHYWHNKDGVNSACYNCQAKREGKLWENQDE